MIGRFLLLFLTVPTITFANIEITEIMYDLEGSDSKREWIEIRNSGTASVDLSDWRFNDGSNHVFNPPPENGGQGALLLASMEAAILASDATTFLSEHNVSGTVIDTVMSLPNTAGTISIQNEAGTIVDEVTYNSAFGGSGNGNSLTKVGSQFIEANPSPLLFVSEGNNDEQEKQETEPVEQTGSAPLSQQISAGPIENKQSVVGGIVLFEGFATGLKEKPLTNARYLWNLGDGTLKEGKHIAHTYQHPGTYRASVIVTSAEFTDTKRFIVEIDEADVSIVYAHRDKTEIQNNSDEELDISYWSLQYKKHIFTFPKGTYLLPKSKGIFPVSVTDIVVEELQHVSLLYPNGTVAHTFLVPVAQEPIVPVQHEETREKEVVYVYVENTKEEKITSEKDETVNSTTSLTSARSIVIENNEKNLYPWLLGLISIVGVGSLVFLSKYPSLGADQSKKELRAKDFKLIE